MEQHAGAGAAGNVTFATGAVFFQAPNCFSSFGSTCAAVTSPTTMSRAFDG